MMDRTHRALWETGKTVLLIVLVLLSIFLTWLSWNHRPPFMAAEKNYTSMPPLGEERELEKIVVPELITFHAAGEHGLALPFTRLHQQTLENLFQWRLTDVTAMPWDEVDWLALRRGTGIELSYVVPVRLADLPWFVAGDGAEPPAGATANRLWPATGEEGVVLYIFDDERRQAYRGMLEAETAAWEALLRSAASLPKAGFYPAERGTDAGLDRKLVTATADRLAADVQNEGEKNPSTKAPATAAEEPAVPPEAAPDGAKAAPDNDTPHEVDASRTAEPGDAAAARDRAPTGWYLPLLPPKVDEEVWRWEPIPLESLYPYLFVDPTFIREIVTRDGVFVYTDGSRSLQVEPSRLRTIYDAPAMLPPSGQEGDEAGHAKTAVQFVNQYGGWTGNYALDGVRQFTPEHVRLLFRYYHRAYPVYGNTPGGEDARIEFSTQPAGQVTTLERPLYRFGEKIQAAERLLPDGEAVYRRFLELKAEGRDIRHIRLAYRMEMASSDGEQKNLIRLVPGWVLIDADGHLHWMKAMEQTAADDG